VKESFSNGETMDIAGFQAEAMQRAFCILRKGSRKERRDKRRTTWRGKQHQKRSRTSVRGRKERLASKIKPEGRKRARKEGEWKTV